jgi:hypothetical protein
VAAAIDHRGSGAMLVQLMIPEINGPDRLGAQQANRVEVIAALARRDADLPEFNPATASDVVCAPRGSPRARGRQ